MKVDSSVSLKKWAVEIDKTFDFNGKKVLDVGCGDGFMVRHIAETYNVESICGIDRGLTECGRCYKLEVGDARCLPYEDNTFDIVYSISTFEHIDGIKKTLDEVRRVLKPYGKFFVAFAPVWTSICGHHCYSYWPAFSDICKENGKTEMKKLQMQFLPGDIYI